MLYARFGAGAFPARVIIGRLLTPGDFGLPTGHDAARSPVTNDAGPFVGFVAMNTEMRIRPASCQLSAGTEAQRGDSLILSRLPAPLSPDRAAGNLMPVARRAATSLAQGAPPDLNRDGAS
jgi:hypothetical protein